MYVVDPDGHPAEKLEMDSAHPSSWKAGSSLVAHSLEGNDDVEAVFSRAVTGGTGDYAGANGQTIHHSIGTNARLGDNLRYRFELLLPADAERR